MIKVIIFFFNPAQNKLEDQAGKYSCTSAWYRSAPAYELRTHRIALNQVLSVAKGNLSGN